MIQPLLSCPRTSLDVENGSLLALDVGKAVKPLSTILCRSAGTATRGIHPAPYI